MPTWVRHVTGTTQVGGFWTGSTQNTFADNCSTKDKTDINAAFTALDGNGGLNCFPELRDQMRTKFATIPIDCCFDNTRPPRSDDDQVRALIFVCQMEARQIQVELCQGLARASGGSTLDAKAMQFSCFGGPEGIPTVADFNEMIALPLFGGNANEREGAFVIWNRTTGEVWNKTTTTTGGFWTGSTSTAKGPRCFVNVGWVF